jgi:peptidoglycan/xylan/chitin deacetylase (PgdA/CDA1 family)
MTILCYHSVEPTWTSPLAVTPAAFDEHCRWLAARRKVVTLREAVTHLDRSWRLPSGMSALTFDDAFDDVFTYALPALQRHGLPATVFVVAETLTPAGRAVDWVDTPPADRQLRTLTLDQLLEMQDAGVEIGSHSYAHHDLTTLTEQECVADLVRSRELLEELLGRSVPFLAYPRGRHNDAVRRASAKAGYTHAFTLPEAAEPVGAHAVPRAGVYPGNGTRSLQVKSARAYLPLRHSPVFPLLRRLAGRGAPVRGAAG